MRIIKKHPLLFGIIVFAIITLFPTIDSYWDLVQKYQAANMNIEWYKWVFPILPIIGVILLIIIIWQTRLPKKGVGLESQPEQGKNNGQRTKIKAIEAKDHATKPVITPEQIGELIPTILKSQYYTPFGDAIYNLNILPSNFPISIRGKDSTSLTLTFNRNIKGCPIIYPLRLYNTRPISIELIGYTINILLNGISVQTVTWDKPNHQTNIGTYVSHPKYVLGDDITILNIEISLAQMQGRIPEASPYWSVKGELRFQGDKDKEFKIFDFTKDEDRYVLLDSDWKYLCENAIPK